MTGSGTDPALIEQLADELGRPVPPLTGRVPGLDLACAYAVQQALTARWTATGHPPWRRVPRPAACGATRLSGRRRWAADLHIAAVALSTKTGAPT